ncbi:hypothetical protein BsWGS_24494 [Bradybaena similaris]
MNTQSAKTLSALFLVVITATSSHAFHLSVHHSNSTSGNNTDSDDFHHSFGEDSHIGNNTQNYQYGRLSSSLTSNFYENTQEVQKEDYKNGTVRVVPPLTSHQHSHSNAGNMKVKSEHQKMPGTIQAESIGANQEEPKELSQHSPRVEGNTFSQNQKKESRQDKRPDVATYKNDIQRSEPDTSTKLLSLEERIAAYLLQHKSQYLHNSPKDKKAAEKKEVKVNELSASMRNLKEHEVDIKGNLRDKNKDNVNLRPHSHRRNFQEDIKEVNKKPVIKYNFYDDISKDDIGTDHVVSDVIVKDDSVKDEIGKEYVNNNGKNIGSNKNGKEINIKYNNKVYDYYYESERSQVTGSTRAQYDYDDKGYVTEDTTDGRQDNHKSKDVLEERPDGKLLHETEILHEAGTFHTVENFVEANAHSQKQQLARRKAKLGSKDSNDNNKDVAVSAFKARVTRGEDENDDKTSVGLKHSSNNDQQPGADHGKDKDLNEHDGSKDSEKVEPAEESNKQFHIGDPLDPIGPAVNNNDIERLSHKDQLDTKQVNGNSNTTLELHNTHTEHISLETDSNETGRRDKDSPGREDEVKTLAKAEISNEPSLQTDQQSLSGMDNVDNVNNVLRYKTDNELPIIRDAKLTSNLNSAQENLPPQTADSTERNPSDPQKPDNARPEAYLAVWASAGSKNSTDPNTSSSPEASSSARLEMVKDNKETPAHGNKTMSPVSQWINETGRDNSTVNSQIREDIADDISNISKKLEFENLKTNAALSNQQMQNISKISQDDVNLPYNASSNTNMNNHTFGNSLIQATSNNTSRSSRNFESTMETNVSKLKATPETASLKLAVKEVAERASSSRKAISQVNEYQKVPDQARPFDASVAAVVNSNKQYQKVPDQMSPSVSTVANGNNQYQKIQDKVGPFDASVATMNNSTNSKLRAPDVLRELNASGSMINVSGSSQLLLNQPTTQIQNANPESSNQVNTPNEANNPSILEKKFLISPNSSVDDTTIRDDNKKEMKFFRDDLNSTTYGTLHNLSTHDYIKNNVSSPSLPTDQAKLQSNSSTQTLKVHKIDDKLPNYQGVDSNMTATQTSKFRVESLASAPNQTEARNIKQESERHIEKPKQLSPTVVNSTKSDVPSQKSIHSNNETLKYTNGYVKENPLVNPEKTNPTTKIADKSRDVIASRQLAQELNAMTSQNKGSHADKANEIKNNTSFHSSGRSEFAQTDSNNGSHKDRQYNGQIYMVSHLPNVSSSINEKIHTSNKSVGLNVPRKLLSFAELEIHEHKSNQTIDVVHKAENNRSLSREASNISILSTSKLNRTSDEINSAPVQIDNNLSPPKTILKNESKILNDSHINPAVKIKNVLNVNKFHHLTNSTTVSLKLETKPEVSRMEQNISISRNIQNMDKTQNTSNATKNEERDTVVKIKFTVKKNSSNPHTEGLVKNVTNNSRDEKSDIEPEVMANERHKQQKTQTQKLEPKILFKQPIADVADLKMDAVGSKDGASSRTNSKDDNDKSKSGSDNSPNQGANGNISDKIDDEEEIGDQQLKGNQRNDNTKDNPKSDDNENKTRNKSYGGSDAYNNSNVLKDDDEDSLTMNKEVVKKQSIDESSSILEEDIGAHVNEKRSDLRGDKKLTNIDAKQIQNLDKVSSNEKAINIGKDISQDGGSATTNDKKSPEADVESGSSQTEPDAENDDVNDDLHKNDKSGHFSGQHSSSSAAASSKIPEISPYKAQDFSLLKPTTDKTTTNKDNNKSGPAKVKPPPPAAAAATKPKNSSVEVGGNASSNARGECQDGCGYEVGGAIPQRAQAAVSAVLTTHFGPTKDQMIPFDLELLDLADNYDNTTGMFICTIPGTYVISLYLMSHPGAKVNARVLINNRPIAALWADDAKNAGFYPSSSTQTIAQLAFGDQVYVMLVDGGYGDSWVHANYNVFTIFLLYEQMF